MTIWKMENWLQLNFEAAAASEAVAQKGESWEESRSICDATLLVAEQIMCSYYHMTAMIQVDFNFKSSGNTIYEAALQFGM